MSLTPIDGTGLFSNAQVHAVGEVLVRTNGLTPPFNPTANWEIVDDEGATLSSGSADDISWIVRGTNLVATCGVTTFLPQLSPDENYYFMWTVEVDDKEASSSETFSLSIAETIDYGLKSTVMIENEDDNKVEYKGVIEANNTDNLSLSLYTPANMLIATVPVEAASFPPAIVAEGEFELDAVWFMVNGSSPGIYVYNPDIHSNGMTYTLPGDTTVYGFDRNRSYSVSFVRGLDPYIWQWRKDGKSVGTSLAWLITNQIAIIMHEVKQSIERVFHYPGLLESAFTNADYAQFLKMGRDLFNSLERPSNFDMTRVDGTIGRMLAYCAQYEMAQSRQLEEALKAFDFSGQATTLTIDLQSAYETYKADMNEKITDVVKPYKKQLAIKGITEGDGSSASTHRGRMPMSLGLTYSRVGTGQGYLSAGQGYNPVPAGYYM